MISIVTGTLNRRHLLAGLLANTVDACRELELVLVDGGSTDGTIEYVKSLRHARVVLIEVGRRSPYAHYMNLGIRRATYNHICQWNDDVLLTNPWSEVIAELDERHWVYLFNWKYGTKDQASDPEFLRGFGKRNGWSLTNTRSWWGGEIVLNYGIYDKDVFRKIGMYSQEFKYYYADADMSERAYSFGFKVKSLPHIKVLALEEQKQAVHYPGDREIYVRRRAEYKTGVISHVEFL